MGWPAASSSIARLILFALGGVACCATIVATPIARHAAMDALSNVVREFFMEISPFGIGRRNIPTMNQPDFNPAPSRNQYTPDCLPDWRLHSPGLHPDRFAMSVTAPAIRGHQQTRGVGVAVLSHCQPPAADSVDCETGGIVIAADTDPPFIIANAVDAVWDGPPRFRVDRVMNLDRLRRSLRTPLPTVIPTYRPRPRLTQSVPPTRRKPRCRR